MRIGSLCSGYGGLEAGVQTVIGGTTAWVSDIDKGACKILAHRFPGVPNIGDMTAVDWATVEPVDLICGGTPCQDLSHAGKRAGMTEGTRSNLWVAMREAIAAIRPKYVVWENVRGAYSAAADSEVEPCPGCVGDGSGLVLRALGRVLGDLSDLGYDASWHGLRAADVGAPHGRFRVFVIATDTRGIGWQRGQGLVTDGRNQGQRRQASSHPGDGSGASVTHLLPTPAVNDMGEGKTVEAWDAWTARMKAEHGNGNGHGASLSIEAQRLLPTPTVEDAAASGGSTPSAVTLTDAVVRTNLGKKENPRHARPSEAGPSEELSDVRGTADAQAVQQRPTRGQDGVPRADSLLSEMREQSSGDSAGQSQVAGSANHGEDLVPGLRNQRASARTSPRPESGEQRPREPIGPVCFMPPDPALVGGLRSTCGCGTNWGQYEVAIRRWERVIGRCAPPPTQLGPRGGPRLDPGLSEFMMGLPAGWVTEVPGITRNEALKALGNGVVPQQAAAALSEMLAWQVAA